MFTYRYLWKSTIVCPVRFYCDSEKLVPKGSIQKSGPNRSKVSVDSKSDLIKQMRYSEVQVEYWNEHFQVKKQRKNYSGLRSVNNPTDLLRYFQNLQSFPLSLGDLLKYMKRRYERNQLAEQLYIPKRVAVLKPDLAAAHFIVRRGGAVKFLGQNHWIGFREKKYSLPATYIPGMYIEGIKAEKTNLYYEGLENLARLKYITFLSLRNLETVNDWYLDWVSKEYYLSLKHLDVSGCKNVTYRGLSCFYRFECLETLEVEGIPDTPEFKLACLMLLEVMPNLDIKGIDLTVPEKIDPVNLEKSKEIPKS